VATDWTAVAGVAIGAGGISGLVSSLITTRHDTRMRRDHRAEDRIAAAKADRYEPRLAIYTALLASADALRSFVGSVQIAILWRVVELEAEGTPTPHQGELLTTPEERETFFTKLTEFNTAAADIELNAYSTSVDELVRSFRSAVGGAFTETSFHTAAAQDAREQLDGVRADLGAACRQDLGHETA
jgi:hypothetical protein